jgi:hypothetical protein
LSGNSRHCAPVPSTHNTPFNTARVLCQGRPRRAPATAGRSTGSTSFHYSSVNSQRPVIRIARRHQSNSRINQIAAPGNYETGSSQNPWLVHDDDLRVFVGAGSDNLRGW